MTISATYIAISAIIFIVLSLNVSLIRKKVKISLGDGNNKELLRAIRTQGNTIYQIKSA